MSSTGRIGTGTPSSARYSFHRAVGPAPRLHRRLNAGRVAARTYGQVGGCSGQPTRVARRGALASLAPCQFRGSQSLWFIRC